MASIFYIHWNEAELKDRVKPLAAAGYQVTSHSTTETAAKIPEPYPEAFVISLDRLPSHGRAIAEWLWEAKKRQGIPIIFEGGQPEKVEATRSMFPRAIFCGTGEVIKTLKRAGV